MATLNTFTTPKISDPFASQIQDIEQRRQSDTAALEKQRAEQAAPYERQIEDAFKRSADITQRYGAASEDYAKQSDEVSKYAEEHVPQPFSVPDFKPEPINRNDMNALAGIVSAFALLAGRNTTNRMNIAGNALAGAIEGYSQGNAIKFERDYKTYKMNFDKAVKTHESEVQQYKDVLNAKNMDLSSKLRRLEIIANGYGDVKMAMTFASHNIDRIEKEITKKEEMANKAADGQEKFSMQLQQAHDRLEMQRQTLQERAMHDREIEALSRSKESSKGWEILQDPKSGELHRVNKDTGEVEAFDKSTQGWQKLGGGGKGNSTSDRFTGNILGSVTELDRSLKQLSHIDVEVSGGLFGSMKQKTNFFDAPLNSTATGLSEDNQQIYRTLSSNLGISLATIENNGYRPNNAIIEQFQNKFSWNPGTSIGAKLYSISDAIAQAETRANLAIASGKIPPGQVSVIKDSLAEVKKLFPYSPEDVIDMTKKGESINEYLKKSPVSGKESSASLPKGIPSGSTLIGHTPDGREVYKSPDGKNHVPD